MIVARTLRHRRVIVTAISVLLSCEILNAGVFYVKQASGSDSNRGTILEPFQSLARAVSMMSTGDTCMVGDGIYRETVSLPSGVTLLAIAGTSPIVTGTTHLDAIWSSYRGNIYAADISKVFGNIDRVNYQVFVDGEAIVEARYPSPQGPAVSGIMDYRRAVCQAGTNSYRITAPASLPHGDLTGAIVTVWPGEDGLSGWVGFSSPVAGTSGDTIRLDSPIGNGSIDTLTGGNAYSPVRGDPFYVSGALSLLDMPGEYFLDTVTKRLYACMPDGDSPQNHRIDLRNRPIVMSAYGASNIRIKGLAIYGSGVSFKNVSDLAIEECSIRYADHVRCAFGYRSADSIPQAVLVTGENILIKKCEFGITACSGIRIGGKNIVLTDNIIHDCDYLGVDYAGVSIAGSMENSKISYNTIYGSGRSLILFDAASSYRNCVIEHNYLKDCSALTSDCGAVYTFASDGGGTEIRYNVIECGNKNDQGAMRKLREGLYVDNCSRNFSIHHNIVVGGGSGLRTNLPDSNTSCYNNTVIGSQYGYGIYGFPKDIADMSHLSFFNNLFINLQKSDIHYLAHENGVPKEYYGSLVRGGVPVPSDGHRRPRSWNNESIKGEIDSSYHFAGNVPADVGAVATGGAMFRYGADWKYRSRNNTPDRGLPGAMLVNRHLRARIVDNTARINAVDYSVLSGYNGLASLVYTGQERNIFAPAGLDFEICSTTPRMGKRADLWDAPRVAPMAVEQLDAGTVRLAQKGSEAAGLNVEIVFHLGDPFVDQTITTWPDSDIQSSHTFWASYMLFVQNTSLYLRGCLQDDPRTQWLEMVSAGHNGTGSGTYFRPWNPAGRAWYEFLTDNPVRRQAVFETPASRAATEKAGFKLGNLKSFDNFFFGFVDDYVALWIFRQPANGRFTTWISASGAQALRRPAADFGIESGPQKAGERRTFYVRFVYKPYAGLDDLLEEVGRFQQPRSQ